MTDLAQMLGKLHKEVAEDLLSKIQSGQATAADLNVAVRFLKDNGIDSNMTNESPLANLAASLPFQAPAAPLKAVS